MSNYGSIPTSTAPGTGTYLTRARERIKTGLSTRRPWKVMFDLRSLRLPSGFSDGVSRVRSNGAYFQTNYAMVVLGVLFLSLLWHPISLIVLVAMMAAWLFLYFLRDQPLLLLRRTIDDRVVLAVLSALTLLFLFLTDATQNILYALLVAALLLLLHAALRKTDDLYLHDEPGLLTTAGPSSSA